MKVKVLIQFKNTPQEEGQPLKYAYNLSVPSDKFTKGEQKAAIRRVLDLYKIPDQKGFVWWIRDENNKPIARIEILSAQMPIMLEV